jgi:DNA-binding response OmpR family regulator
MNRVLIIEDDPAIAQLIADHLERAGHSPLVTHDGEEGLSAYEASRPELIVLDLMLPGRSGLEVCRAIRAGSGAQPVILILTARGDEEDALEGFEAGADDFVRKPFSVRELLVRTAALLRLSGRAPGAPRALVFGALRIDTSARTAHVGAQAVPLTPLELDLLIHLARRPGVALSREALLHGVWGYSHAGYARTVDSHVTRVRKKLTAAGLSCDPIATAHRVGYRFEPPETAA